MMLQNDREDIKNALLRYYNEGVFTACALAVAKLEKNAFSTLRFFYGKTARGERGSEVDKWTFFDVASLTKALVTVPSLLALLHKGKLHLQQPLPELLPYPIPGDKRRITLEQLVSHTSGLPSHKEYYNDIARRKRTNISEDVCRLIVSEPLVSKPGERYCYSDLDYMLLGRIIEEKAGESLSSYWLKTIIEPLGLGRQYYYPTDNLIPPKEQSFAETGRCPWSGAVLRGVVHDDNCRFMGGMSGHAGLFSTLDGILFLCNNIALNYTGKERHPSFSQEDLRYLASRSRGGGRAPGFDVPRESESSAGSFFSYHSIGHLGFTGTSFWIDLERQISVVLLTNRVYCGDAGEGIRRMRPDIHDRVMKSLVQE